MREGIGFLAFTDRGEALAEKLAGILGGETARAGRDVILGTWTEAAFREKAALVYVGAVGIAVRAVAPYLKHKAEDPAVLAVDETGHYVIPLLSGHLGGANALARELAAITGGEAVITTATDLHGVFAVDLWAKRQNMTVRQPERIKTVSMKLLSGQMIHLDCRWEIRGDRPENVRILPQSDAGQGGALPKTEDLETDVLVDYRDASCTALQLVPHILHLGIGCRKGTGAETLEAGLERFCREKSILPEAIRSAASVDLKSREEGLLRFCRDHGWPIRFYTAEELNSAEGIFSSSEFVRTVTGVDNICERAAVLESGGRLIESKYALDGVTFALAEETACFDWSW